MYFTEKWIKTQRQNMKDKLGKYNYSIHTKGGDLYYCMSKSYKYIRKKPPKWNKGTGYRQIISSIELKQDRDIHHHEKNQRCKLK